MNAWSRSVTASKWPDAEVITQLARVLVAEDDGLTRRFIEETLEFAGHDVTSASNGAEAISAVDAPAASTR